MLAVGNHYCVACRIVGEELLLAISGIPGERPARCRRIEFDAISRDQLAPADRRKVERNEPPAEPAFHHPVRIASLAIAERWRPVRSFIRHARHTAEDLDCRRRLPDEIAGVKAAMHSVLIECRDEPVDDKRTAQRMRKRRIAGNVGDRVQLQRMSGFQRLALRLRTRMHLAQVERKGALDVLR